MYMEQNYTLMENTELDIRSYREVYNRLVY